jgi:hypothetical protein
MFRKIVKLSALALAATIGVARTAHAAPVLIQNGTSAVVDGWNITVPTGVSLSVDNSTAGTLTIEKAVDFTSSAGLIIAFTQVATPTATNIDFINEAISNTTGSAFNGFTFAILNATGGSAKFTSAFTTPASGYTGGTISAAGDMITYSGGQANDSTSMWGQTAGAGQIGIAATPGGSASFGFEELPGGGGPTPPVPLPAALWQSAVGFALIGFVAAAKKLKNRAA